MPFSSETQYSIGTYSMSSLAHALDSDSDMLGDNSVSTAQDADYQDAPETQIDTGIPHDGHNSDYVHVAGLPRNYGEGAELNSHASTVWSPVRASSPVSSRCGGVGRHRKSPPRFKCPNVHCLQRFTTTYRLRTHCNRFHTAPELQRRFSCGIGFCVYSTCYTTALRRHQKNCMMRQLADFDFNYDFCERMQ